MIPNFTAAFSSVIGAANALKASQEQRRAHDADDPNVIDVEAREVEEPARREPPSLVAAYDGYKFWLPRAPSERP